MYTPWQVIVQELVAGGSPHLPDLVRFAYAGSASEGAMLQALAQILMISDPQQALLTQGYALSWYLKEREWHAAVACAEDSLCFSSLKDAALEALFMAGFQLGDYVLLERCARQVCIDHQDGSIPDARLMALFFNAIVPYYYKRERLQETSVLRRVLHGYSPALNHLLYTHLQTNLYAYTTDVAQELIGQPDVFSRE